MSVIHLRIGPDLPSKKLSIKIDGRGIAGEVPPPAKSLLLVRARFGTWITRI